MVWTSRKNSANSNIAEPVLDDKVPVEDEEQSVQRPQPQIIEADDDEGAELIFTDPYSTPTKRKGSDIETTVAATTPRTHTREEDEDEEEQSIRTTSSVSLTKDLETTGMTTLKTRRFLALGLVLFLLVVIILGIVFGTKRARDASEKNKTTNSAVGGEQEEEEEVTPSNALSNDKCAFPTMLLPDGPFEVGVITSTSQSTFSNGGGTCGDAIYSGDVPGKWFFTQGTGDFLNLTACDTNCTAPANALAIPEVSVFTGACDDLYCIDGVSNLLDQGPLTFQSIRGQDYYIYVQGGEGTLGLVEVALTEA